MNGFLKCLKWIGALVVVFVPAIVLGDSPLTTAGSSPLWDMFQNLSFTPTPTDMSVTFLGKMFGAMPGISLLSGSGQTILGTVFGVFNGGVLALSGVFLGYTITKVLTETTMDGAAMGKSTTIWTAVRCSLSVSLLAPQASGYSTLNSIIMWVVIQSVGLADMTWNTAIQYLQKGSPVYSVPVSYVDYSLINYGMTVDDPSVNKIAINDTNYGTSVGAADVLRSLTCAYVVQNALQASQLATQQQMESEGTVQTNPTLYSNAITPIPTNVFSLFSDTPVTCTGSGVGCSGGVVEFPYIINESSNPLSKYGLNVKSNNIPKLSGICGRISYGVTKGQNESNSDFAARLSRYSSVKQQGLRNMIDLLKPAAEQLVQRIQATDTTQLNYNTYPLYQDNKGANVLFFNPDATDKFLPDSQTSTTLLSDFSSAGLSGLPSGCCNWPFAADEMLGAVAMYQIALTSAQQGGVNSVSSSQQQEFDLAKKQGWITAGNYYRLLSAAQQSVNLEYSSYRLTGLDAITGEAFKDTNVLNRSDYPYMTLFPSTTKPSDSSGPIGTIDSNSLNTLQSALKWITYAYPYAKLHGSVMTPPQASSENAMGLNLGIIGRGGNYNATGIEAAIYIQMIAGAALLPSPYFVIGVPLLTFVPLEFLQLDVNKIFNVWDANMGGNSTLDPILKLQNIGNAMIDNSLAFTTQLQVFFLAISIALGVGSTVMSMLALAVSPGSFLGITTGVGQATQAMIEMYHLVMEMCQTIVFMFIPVAIGVLGPIFVSGVIFAIYVPLIPYLLFLFGAISWLISVLVLMAGAPIICFLMLWGNSSQENPLLAREAEQFVMQIIGVFFRPILMVIGLITGMVLSYIGVDLLNLGFTNVVDLIVGSSNGNLKLIKQVGVIVVYTFTMVSIVNLCFSTIHLLYSEAMRVAGITTVASGIEEKYTEGVKGGVQQMGEAGAGVAKEEAGSLKGTAKAKFGSHDAPKKESETSGAQGGDSSPPK